MVGLVPSTLFAQQLSIRRVHSMPNRPQPYLMRDWQKVARDYDALVFDYQAKGRFLPLIKPDLRHENYPGESFALTTYIGSDSIDHEWLGGEAINGMAAVVSASLAGIDKSRQGGRNYVLMCQKWFNSENGQHVYLNTSHSTTGGSFWYSLFPNVLAYQLNYLYPNSGELPEHTIAVADRYYEASVKMGGREAPWTIPEYNYRGFNLMTGKPTETGSWKEPDAAAGIAWLEYMAWVQHGTPRYLTGAKWGMAYISNRPKNPYYEMLLPYGAYLAARMNAELGMDYDIPKIMNWIFDGDSECRPGWGVFAERWGGYDVDGLVGSLTDGGGYAFAMNGFEQAGALIPLVRYDKRFAHDIGKWALNLANASRFYYANGLDPSHQSSWDWATQYDQKFAIPYEGLRKEKQGYATPLSDFHLGEGRIVTGNYTSLRHVNDGAAEVIEEQCADGHQRLEHVWDFDLPKGEGRALLMQAGVTLNTNKTNSFRISIASSPEGPYSPAFDIDKSSSYWYQIPDAVHGHIYVKVESTNRTIRSQGLDRISIDSLILGYPTTISPYAQGDEQTGKKPGSTTDFSLYSGSHVGILGGIIRTTNVSMILQLDLLKTDYYHARAYPTYLYYNPYDIAKDLQIDVGPTPVDLYNTVGSEFIKRNVTGNASVNIPADTAMVIVLAPVSGRLIKKGSRTLINGVVIDYGTKTIHRQTR